jgi:hypothetical protein
VPFTLVPLSKHILLIVHDLLQINLSAAINILHLRYPNEMSNKKELVVVGGKQVYNVALPTQDYVWRRTAFGIKSI